MEFRLLGPFEAWHDGAAIPLGRRRQERLLLALLLLEPDRMVTVERIAALLWEGEPSPSDRRGTIHTYVGRLRRALRPYGVSILTRREAYVIESGTHTIDVAEFASLLRGAGQVTDPADRLRRYDAALGLWRGPLLADLLNDPTRERFDRTLVEMRLSAAELRAEAQLDMGLHDRVIVEMSALAEAVPTRERLTASLMAALYRAGRQAEALDAYRRARTMLVDELGIEPGTDLQALHGRILRGDPTLERPPQAIFALHVKGVWLPWNTSGHPALEFCNTYAGWQQPPKPHYDWLRGYPTLAIWAGHHDLLDDWTVTRLLRTANEAPKAADEALDAARDLRTGLYRAFSDPDDVQSFEIVAAYAEQAARASVFRRGADGLGGWRLTADAGLMAPVYAAARAGTDLLADPRRFTINACPAPECGWLFLDHSGMRRFCSIATCGKNAPEAHRYERGGAPKPADGSYAARTA